MNELEKLLRGLLKGEHSSLTLSFNEHCASYQNAAEAESVGDFEHFDWVSEDERKAAIAANSVWVLHWYPNTPVGFRALGASSLPALLAEAIKDHN
jgi:hypothetical protein